MANLRNYFPMLVVALGALAGLSCGSAARADDGDAAKGLAILQKHCARCHGLRMTGNSPHPQAPPFRDVVERYPVEDLEESLAEGIVSGHPDNVGIHIRAEGDQFNELRKAAPEAMNGFYALSKAASARGAMDKKTKELVALAIGVTQRCDGCIAYHTKALKELGAAARRSWSC